jgi:hypothetical protein
VKEVKNFDAIMGGTEILAPLQDIYADPVDLDLPRQIYLLTDGAVNNTKQIVELVRSHRKTCRVHTFGIGDGASSELVKECAQAGLGHYSFIDNPKDIEKKVMEALSKDFLEYLTINEAIFLDSSLNPLKTLDVNDFHLGNGERFIFTDLLPAGRSAHFFKFTVTDPNT